MQFIVNRLLHKCFSKQKRIDRKCPGKISNFINNQYNRATTSFISADKCPKNSQIRNFTDLDFIKCSPIELLVKKDTMLDAVMNFATTTKTQANCQHSYSLFTDQPMRRNQLLSIKAFHFVIKIFAPLSAIKILAVVVVVV